MNSGAGTPIHCPNCGENVKLERVASKKLFPFFYSVWILLINCWMPVDSAGRSRSLIFVADLVLCPP